MSVRVHFVGSGDAFGSGGRLQACILVEHDGGRLLLDCGTSSLIGLKRDDVDPNSIGTVVVSHLHGDHFGGIPFLVLDGQFSRRQTDLTIVGPPGTNERVLAAMEVLYPGSSSVQRRFELPVVEIDERTRHESPAGFNIVPFAADHASGAPAYSYRVELGDAVIAYSGDTAWHEGLIDAAADADLFICEAYSAERRVPYHLDLGTLAANRGRLRAGRIILTHMTSEVLSGKDDGWERAYDGMRVEIP